MKKHESGQLMVIVALGTVVFLGFAALAIDLGRAYSERRLGQNAADAAALAGMRTVRKQPNPPDASSLTGAQIYTIIQQVAQQNGAAQLYPDADGGAVFLDQNKNVLGNVSTWGTNYSGVYGVRVRAKITYNTFFAGIVGMPQMTSSGTATAMSFNVGLGNLLPVAYHIQGNCVDTNFGYLPAPTQYTFFDNDPENPGGFGWVNFQFGAGSAGQLTDWIVNGFTGNFDWYQNYYWTGDIDDDVAEDTTPGNPTDACEFGWYKDGGTGIDPDPSPPPKKEPTYYPKDCDGASGGCDLKGSNSESGNPMETISWMQGNTGLSVTQELRDAIEALEGEDVIILVYNKLDKTGANTRFQIVGWTGFHVDEVDMQGNPKYIKGSFVSVVVGASPTPVPGAGGISTVRLVPN